MAKKKHKGTVIRPFKVNEKGVLKKYELNDVYSNTNLDSINHLKNIKLIK